MTTVALLPNGQHLMTYEYGGAPGGGGFPVYYRMAADPRAFAAAKDHPLVAGGGGGGGGRGGTRPTSSPYVVWTSYGGDGNGTIIVSANSHAQLFSNSALGDEARWETHSIPQPAAYTRMLRVLQGDATRLLVMGAGHLPPSSTNAVSMSLVDLAKVLGK